MDLRTRYQILRTVAQDEFAHIVTGSLLVGGTVLKPRVLRLNLSDRSYLDIRLATDGYAFHWERRSQDSTLYRWDDAPHHREVMTFPHHLHSGSESHVLDSHIPITSAESALRYVLGFIEEKIEEIRG